MYLWRISKYADLSGRGGLILDGRWHRKGIPVVYCSDHPSTALLEVLVHLNPDQIPASFQLIKIRCPDGTSVLNPADRPSELSPNERTIWELVATGTTSETLSKTLGISIKTIDAYVQSVRNKTQRTDDIPEAIAALLQKPVENKEISQAIGMKWLENKSHCLMRVPSSVMPAANNYLINPRHADAENIIVEETISYPFDSRLLE